MKRNSKLIAAFIAVAGGAALVEVVVPTLSETAKIGELVFIENCAACHSVNAAGQDGVAPPLIYKIYAPSHHGDRSFVLGAKQGCVRIIGVLAICRR